MPISSANGAKWRTFRAKDRRCSGLQRRHGGEHVVHVTACQRSAPRLMQRTPGFRRREVHHGRVAPVQLDQRHCVVNVQSTRSG